MQTRSIVQWAVLLALIFTTLSLGPGFAHLFALPNKMKLDATSYLAAQRAYDGWALFGVVLLAQLMAILVTIVTGWATPGIRWPGLIALAGLVASQVLFWGYTFPANTATNNWTRLPDDWQHLRYLWEYSHAAGALVQFVGLIALAVAAFAAGRTSRP